MPTKRTSLLIFPLLSTLFCFSMFYRLTNAVIAPDLIRAFHLNAERLGMLSSAFFYTFALFQIPMGVLLDRIGPRKVITVFTLVGAAGAFVFACAGGFYVALLGRALLGIGMASALMGSFKVFVNRYPPRRFSTLSGAIISIGTLGPILATSPLVYLNSIIGWRLTFVYCGIITVALAFLLFWVLKEDHHGGGQEILVSASAGQQTGVIKSLKLVFGTLSFWQISSLAFFRYGAFVALQGVWLGPFLMNLKGFSPLTAGNILMTLSVGGVIGAPIAGYLAERVFGSTKSVILFGMGCYVLCFVPLTGVLRMDSAAAYATVFMLQGFFSSFGMLTYTHIKELFPLSMSGTVIAAVNFFVMAGGAVFMQIIGTIISSYSGTHQIYSAGAYHLAFLICLLGIIASLIFYAFSKTPHGGAGEGGRGQKAVGIPPYSEG
ncbi:MAG: MFS transporter [Desulfobacterales bacterium]|nr:MFS transporter [Desulfobacterales bacterium]